MFLCESIEINNNNFTFNVFDFLTGSHMYSITEEYYEIIKNMYFDFKEKLNKFCSEN